MRKVFALAFGAAIVFAAQAHAWNEKGHLVVCRLAWLQLTDQQRAQVTAILKNHPHYQQYLIAGKHDGFTDDEWAFMKAGAWADWIRSGSARSYGHSTWHYINFPVTFPDGGVDGAKHQPRKARKTPCGPWISVWTRSATATTKKRPCI